MKQSTLNRPIHVPPWLIGLRAQAIMLLLVGSAWLIAISLVWADGAKSIGAKPLLWWVLYLGVPIPLTVWGIRFAIRKAAELRSSRPLDWLFYAVGIAASAPPAVLFLTVAVWAR
jgi:hypothetical protein